MSDEFKFVNLHDSVRLDRFLTEQLAKSSRTDLSRTAIKELITEGAVKVNDAITLKASFHLSPNDRVEIVVPPRKESGIVPQDIALNVLYEDEVMLVINKPAGLVVHPGAGNQDQTLANALAARHHEASTLPRAGIVHRLDKETSGVMVVAKSAKAYLPLVRSFAQREVKKEYHALILSTPRHDRIVPKKENGTLEAPIGRDAKNPAKMAVRQDGRPAITHWEIIERMAYAVYVRVKIETGRTHQIRVHMANAGSPVIGDKIYGDFSLLPRPLKEIAKRHALHAYHIELSHPLTGEKIEFTAPLPQDFTEILNEFRSIH